MPITLAVHAAALPSTAHVVGITGDLALSTTYLFQIGIRSEGEHPELAELVGSRATLTVPEGEDEAVFHGMIRTAELVHAWDGARLTRITLVPRLWELSQTLHSRVFVDMSVNDVVAHILDEHGIAHRFAIAADDAQHPELEHICQYRESDLQFVQRLLEREGSYYFFDQSGDEEVLVIEDTCGAEYGPQLTYAPGTGADLTTSSAYLEAFVCRHNVLAGTVELTGYDDQKPQHEVNERRELGTRRPTISLFNEAATYATKQPSALADVRTQELAAQSVTFEGRGKIYGVQPGYAFKVAGHPASELNQPYIATRLRIRSNEAVGDAELTHQLGLSAATYEAEISAIPRSAQYRPPRNTPIPRIDGVETAVVESTEDGTYAHLDEHGRYRIRMHFDEHNRRSSATNITTPASMWVRMMQPHAGAPEGAHFPLRAGTEVMVVFLGGDPDRPVIAGAVPNPTTPSVVLKATATRNVLESGSQNRLMMEDNEGSERVELASPAENTRIGIGAAPSGTADGVTTDDLELPGIRMRTDANLNTFVGQDREAKVEGDETIEVTGNHDATYSANHDTTVAGNLSLTVTGDLTENITGSVSRVFDSTTDLIFTGAHSTSYVSAVNENYVSAKNSNYVSAVNNNYLAVANNNYAAAVNNNYVGLTMNNYVAGINNNYVGIAMNNYVAGANNNYLGATMNNYVAVTMNNYVALTSNNYLGVAQNLYAAAQIDTFAAAKASVSLGAYMDISASIKASVWAGLNVSLGAGADISILVGFKLKEKGDPAVTTCSFDCHI